LSLDLAKYRTIFVEDATENLAEISRALIELEKEPSGTDEIDLIFRMAHSIKGMAASLGYESVAEIAHCLEDRMQVHRSASSISSSEDLSLLFRGLEALEQMVGEVRETEDAPPPRPELAEALAAPVSPPDAYPSEAKKKALSPSPCRPLPR
jgi:two-component system chemotaxis sensor kinase CheA